MNKALILLFTLAILAFASCKKCADCNRTWTQITYNEYPDGSTEYYSESWAGDENFDVCGSNDIKNAEEDQIRTFDYQDSTFIHRAKLVGKCECFTK